MFSNMKIGLDSYNNLSCSGIDVSNFRASNEPIAVQPKSWLLNKQSPFKELINQQLMWLHATGLSGQSRPSSFQGNQGFLSSQTMDQPCLKSAVSSSKSKLNCTENQDYSKGPKAISISHLYKLFYCYLAGNFLAFIIFGFEVCQGQLYRPLGTYLG